MFKKLLLSAALLFSVSSHAELVHSDYKTDGDGLVTYDTTTGISWLKFHADQLTRTTTINGLANYTGPGGALEGWRLATLEEVLPLWQGIFGADISKTSANSVNFANYGVTLDELHTYQEYLGGGPWGSTGYTYSAGSFWQTDSQTSTGIAGFVASASGTGHYHAPEVVRNDQNAMYGTVSLFLIQDGYFDLYNQGNLNAGGGGVSDVPVQGGVAALLIAMAAWRRRQVS